MDKIKVAFTDGSHRLFDAEYWDFRSINNNHVMLKDEKDNVIAQINWHKVRYVEYVKVEVK